MLFKNVETSSREVPVILVGFYCNLNFLDRFFKKLKDQVSSKSVQWEPSCSMRTDGHETFRNFANAPKTVLNMNAFKAMCYCEAMAKGYEPLVVRGA